MVTTGIYRPSSSTLSFFLNDHDCLTLKPCYMVAVKEIYIPGTQMTLVLVGKGLVLGGLTYKNRVHWGSRYTKNNTFLQKRSP